ncbi:response regulator [Guyparkeria hydrothermalis]|uniref:response regulator n=1 Tax=Guyparkeria hydrothermalis TaxID=923 RepID=UPI002021FE5A|nr:response regulator [Guyparkeria hydrothermalis]MCL7743699.1 response regulator [Guyparkeria hydrothermalis]
MADAFIMLVDDERALTEEIAEVLRAEGGDVELASDGIEAFSQAERRLPAMVLVDQNMPGMSGLDLVRNLRTLPGGERIAVLMMSAHFTEQQREEGARLAVDRFLRKPFDLDEVVDWVLGRMESRGESVPDRPDSLTLEGRVEFLEAQVAQLKEELRRCRLATGSQADGDNG